MLSAWMYGHDDLARAAAERLIDLVWNARDEEIKSWKPSGRARYVFAAKELLEVIE